MRIDSIQTSQEVVVNNKVQPEEEFSTVLSQAITKVDEQIKEESVGEQAKDSEEQDAQTDLFQSLGGVLNITFLEKRPQEIIVLDTNILVDQVEEISQEIAMPSIDAFIATDVSQGNVLGEEEVIQVGFVETSEQKATLILDKPFTEDLEESIKPIDHEKGLKPQKDINVISVSTDKSTISTDKSTISTDKNTISTDKSTISTDKTTISNKSTNEEISVIDHITPKEATGILDGVDIEKVNTELQPKETKSLKEKEDINIIAGTQIKDIHKIDFQTKTATLEPELSHENLLKVDQSIMELMEITKEGDTNILKVKLYPKDLGTVDVVLKMQEGKLIAKILVDTDYIKGLFVGKVNELNEGLIKQNIHLEKLDIDLNLNSNRDSNSGFGREQKESFNQRRDFFRKDQGRYRTLNNISEVVNESYSYNKGAISILA